MRNLIVYTNSSFLQGPGARVYLRSKEQRHEYISTQGRVTWKHRLAAIED